MNYDIVYLLKNNYDEEELRYSLRSVVQNFPFRKIVFVGGCPSGITPDIYIKDEQVGTTKWERSTHSLKKALACDELTEKIWLFNDDFFVMDSIRNPKNYFGGSLEKRVIDLKLKNPRGSKYINELDALRGQLIRLKKDTLSFALHIPMLVDRRQAQQVFDEFPKVKMFRSFYGNYFQIDCELLKEDVKIYDLESLPEDFYCSTSDEAFKNGKSGEFLRRYFATPTRYESDEVRRSEVKELFTEEGDLL